MKIRSSDKFHERQDKRVRRTHKKSYIFYQEMMVFVPIAILLKCIPDKSASRRGFNQNFSRKMTKAYQTECAPNLQYFFAVNFYQSKKKFVFVWKVGLEVCLVSHSLPVLWIAHLAVVILLFEDTKSEHACYVVGSGDCGLGLHVVRGECS